MYLKPIIQMSKGCENCSKTARSGCKNNGSCQSNGGCAMGSTFDWLANIPPSSGKKFDILELYFKNGRKEFYRNTVELPLQVGEKVVVECNDGYDIGTVNLNGELVRIQLKNIQLDKKSTQIKKIYRKATERDLAIWKTAKNKEIPTLQKAKAIVKERKLPMKISDVEYQGDGSKAVFYYTCDNRIDFRELVKIFAGTFCVRIEMRQIGYRQEASKIGGIGSCGRELCCSSWLKKFKNVNTSAARYQQLSINSQKIAGQCGKLKCCLNFELDTYLEALKEFPDINKKIQTDKDNAYCIKIDVFKKQLWYVYRHDPNKVFSLSLHQVKKAIETNRQGHKAPGLEELCDEKQEGSYLTPLGLKENNSNGFSKNNVSVNKNV